jgi:hypothetical protein
VWVTAAMCQRTAAQDVDHLRLSRRWPLQIGTRVAHGAQFGREFGSTMRCSGTPAITRNDGVRGSSPRVGLLEARKSLEKKSRCAG